MLFVLCHVKGIIGLNRSRRSPLAAGYIRYQGAYVNERFSKSLYRAQPTDISTDVQGRPEGVVAVVRGTEPTPDASLGSGSLISVLSTVVDEP
jgi:hypothetical protein